MVTGLQQSVIEFWTTYLEYSAKGDNNISVTINLPTYCCSENHIWT